MIQRFDILNVKMSAINMFQACRFIQDLIERNKKSYVCVCPVSTIMECVGNPEIMNIVNNADLVTPDGMPLVWIAKAKGLKNIGRVYGPDLMLALCELSSHRGYRNYFYGSTMEVLEKLSSKLKQRFPSLQICGMYAPPFRPLTKEEDNQILEDINSTSPDIVWVGLGSPKQDIWIFEHRDKLNAGVSLAVGAAFDFLSGMKPQAPRWMQRTGLEWLFRLCSEPKRLWKRYLIGNTMFIYLLFKESIKKRLRKI